MFGFCRSETYCQYSFSSFYYVRYGYCTAEIIDNVLLEDTHAEVKWKVGKETRPALCCRAGAVKLSS